MRKIISEVCIAYRSVSTKDYEWILKQINKDDILNENPDYRVFSLFEISHDFSSNIRLKIQ